jgi:hypothetical protein
MHKVTPRHARIRPEDVDALVQRALRGEIPMGELIFAMMICDLAAEAAQAAERRAA